MGKVLPLERVYKSEDVVNKLNISASSLRTYTSHFRKAGHVFRKENGRVCYVYDDLQLLKRMLQLHTDGHGTVKQCVLSVLGRENNVDKLNTTSFQKEIDALRVEYKEEIAKLKSYIDQKVHERDMELLRLIRESRKAKTKKKPWWMFWK